VRKRKVRKGRGVEETNRHSQKQRRPRGPLEPITRGDWGCRLGLILRGLVNSQAGPEKHTGVDGNIQRPRTKTEGTRTQYTGVAASHARTNNMRKVTGNNESIKKQEKKKFVGTTGTCPVRVDARAFFSGHGPGGLQGADDFGGTGVNAKPKGGKAQSRGKKNKNTQNQLSSLVAEDEENSTPKGRGGMGRGCRKRTMPVRINQSKKKGWNPKTTDYEI